MSEIIALIIVGVALIVMGIINIRGNISTLHWYHRKRVAESDIPAMGKIVGTGSVITGVSILLTGIISCFVQSQYLFIIVIIGMALGLPIMLYGIIKYNKLKKTVHCVWSFCCFILGFCRQTYPLREADCQVYACEDGDFWV